MNVRHPERREGSQVNRRCFISFNMTDTHDLGRKKSREGRKAILPSIDVATQRIVLHWRV